MYKCYIYIPQQLTNGNYQHNEKFSDVAYLDAENETFDIVYNDIERVAKIVSKSFTKNNKQKCACTFELENGFTKSVNIIIQDID